MTKRPWNTEYHMNEPTARNSKTDVIWEREREKNRGKKWDKFHKRKLIIIIIVKINGTKRFLSFLEMRSRVFADACGFWFVIYIIHTYFFSLFLCLAQWIYYALFSWMSEKIVRFRKLNRNWWRFAWAVSPIISGHLMRLGDSHHQFDGMTLIEMITCMWWSLFFFSLFSSLSYQLDSLN